MPKHDSIKEEELQSELVTLIKENDWNVRQLEEYIQQLSQPKEEVKKKNRNEKR